MFALPLPAFLPTDFSRLLLLLDLPPSNCRALRFASLIFSGLRYYRGCGFFEKMIGQGRELEASLQQYWKTCPQSDAGFLCTGMAVVQNDNAAAGGVSQDAIGNSLRAAFWPKIPGQYMPQNDLMAVGMGVTRQRRPEGAVRRAEQAHVCAGKIFQQFARGLQLGGEDARVLPAQIGMMPRVITDAMARGHAFDEVRITLRPLADEKKRRRNIKVIEHLQNERRALGMRAVVEGEVNLIRRHGRAAPQPGHQLDKNLGHALKAIEEELRHEWMMKRFR